MSNNIISNQWVFEDSWDATIVHRNQELSQLSRSLEPALGGDRADDVLIHGSSGVGKSSTMQWMLRDLRNRGEIATVSVECSGKTPYQILDTVVNGHPEAAITANHSRAGLLDALERVTTDPYVVVLDEADVVPDLDVLADLCSVEMVSVLAIAHDEPDWIRRLDVSVQNNFPTDSRIHFERYHDHQIVDILKPRVREGLEPHTVTEGQLEWIADEVAGVARFAIKSVHAAAELAEERGHDYLHERDVDDSFDHAKAMMREDSLQSLPVVYRRVYELLRRVGLVEGKDLKTAYNQNAEEIFRGRDRDPVTWRRVLDYLSKLEEYDLVDVEGRTNSKRYSAIDPGLEASVDVEFETNRVT